MINFRRLTTKDVVNLKDIDRSERIEIIYRMKNGNLQEVKKPHDCPNWDASIFREIEKRFEHELNHGGQALGAFDEDLLVGFGVLAHKFRGAHQDTLQVDLMYVSKDYRRQGIGKRIMTELGNEAKRRGAKYLYISATETESAVNFYKNCGSELAVEIDQELFDLEPEDIHMVKRL